MALAKLSQHSLKIIIDLEIYASATYTQSEPWNMTDQFSTIATANLSQKAEYISI